MAASGPPPLTGPIRDVVALAHGFLSGMSSAAAFTGAGRTGHGSDGWVRGSAPSEEHRCADLPGRGVPGLGQRAVCQGECLGLGLFAVQAQRSTDVYVKPWAAQRSGEQPRHLFEGAAGCQCAGSGLAHGYDLGAGGVREMEQAGVEGAGRSLADAFAMWEAAFRVEQDGAARGQCGLGFVQCLGGSWVVPVNRDVSLAREDTAEQGDVPQPCGCQDDGLGAEAVQGGEDDRGVAEGGVVGDDDAARNRSDPASVVTSRRPKTGTTASARRLITTAPPGWRTPMAALVVAAAASTPEHLMPRVPLRSAVPAVCRPPQGLQWVSAVRAVVPTVRSSGPV